METKAWEMGQIQKYSQFWGDGEHGFDDYDNYDEHDFDDDDDGDDSFDDNDDFENDDLVGYEGILFLAVQNSSIGDLVTH